MPRYVPSKDIIACNGFGFKGVGEHSLSVWLLIPLFFPLFPRIFFVTSESQASYAELKLPSIEKESYVLTYVFNEAMYSILSL